MQMQNTCFFNLWNDKLSDDYCECVFVQMTKVLLAPNSNVVVHFLIYRVYEYLECVFIDKITKKIINTYVYVFCIFHHKYYDFCKRDISWNVRMIITPQLICEISLFSAWATVCLLDCSHRRWVTPIKGDKRCYRGQFTGTQCLITCNSKTYMVKGQGDQNQAVARSGIKLGLW